MTEFPIHICLWCNEENPTDNHRMTCAETFKPKKFIPQSQWISVKDRLPDFDVLVLIHHDDYTDQNDNDYSSIEVAFYSPSTKWVVPHFCENSYFNNVTHWMPLPDSPK